MKLTPRHVLEMLRAEAHHPQPDLEDLGHVLEAALPRPGFEAAADYLAQLAAQGLERADAHGWRWAQLAAHLLPDHPLAPDAQALLVRWRALERPDTHALKALAALGRGQRLSLAALEEISLEGVRRCGQELQQHQADALVGLTLVTLAHCALDMPARRQEAARVLAALRGAQLWSQPLAPSDAPRMLAHVPPEVHEYLYNELQRRLRERGACYFTDNQTLGRSIGRRWTRYGQLQEAAASTPFIAAVVELSQHRGHWGDQAAQALVTILYQQGIAGLQRRGVLLRRPTQGFPPPPQIQEGASLAGYDGQLAVQEALAACECLLRIGERTLAQQTAILLLDILGRVPGQAAYQEWARRIAYQNALA